MQSDTRVQTTEQLTNPTNARQLHPDSSDSALKLGDAIDSQVLENWRVALGENSTEFLVKVIGIYFDEATNLLQAIAAAVSKGDARTIEREAHTLKSSSATLGATTLSQLCKSLEYTSRAGNTLEASELVPQVCNEYERVKAALQRERQQCLAELSQSGVTIPLLD